MRLLVSDSPDFTNAALYSSYDVNFYIGSIIVENISPAIIPVNSTKYFTIASVSPFTSLRVQLQQFSASTVNNEWVNLNWQTTAETGTNYFTIERSVNGTRWETAATVQGAGNTNAVKNYSTIDKYPYTGASYYRLKQTDANGKSTYSAVKTVTIDKIKGNELIVYPNPAENQLTIKGSAAELKTMRLYNLAGQDLTNLIKITAQTNTSMVINISKLETGIYSIKTATTVTKLLKK